MIMGQDITYQDRIVKIDDEFSIVYKKLNLMQFFELNFLKNLEKSMFSDKESSIKRIFIFKGIT